jgi:hypothetical protein
VPIVTYQDVGRLQVPVDNIAAMRIGHANEGPFENLFLLVAGEPALFQEFVQ